MDKITLLGKGFKEIVYSSFELDVGQGRNIRVGGVGTTYESLYLSKKDGDRLVTDMILVHNYGLGGPLTEEKLDLIISIFA